MEWVFNSIGIPLRVFFDLFLSRLDTVLHGSYWLLRAEGLAEMLERMRRRGYDVQSGEGLNFLLGDGVTFENGTIVDR